MVVIDLNLMNFLCDINTKTNGKYYVAFDNESDDIIFVESRTGNYKRIAFQICKEYYTNTDKFIHDLL